MGLKIWEIGIFVAAALCVDVAIGVRFLSNGEPCGFPFDYQGEEVWDCVPFGGGGEWCRGLDGAWGQCHYLQRPAPLASRTVVPTVDLPNAELKTGNSSAEVVDLTVLYYGECCRRLAEIEFQSNLPIMIIDTEKKEIPDEPKTTATMCTCGSQGDEFDGPIGIEIRGSTSARDYDKKSYAIETREAGEDSKDVKLMGLPEENDWILYGPEADKTMGFRNLISYTLSRAMGRYASRLRYFELFLIQDGKPLSKKHYNGIYLLAEKVKRGNDRVDISKRKGEDLSGGYIFKYDNDNQDPGDVVFDTTLSSLQFIMIYPKASNISKEEIKAIRGYMNDFEADLVSKSFTKRGKGYDKHIDVDSFVDYFLLTEITKNPDGYRGSAYVHKDVDGPLAMGPVWDYNEAYGMCCGFPIEGFQNGGRSTGRSGGSAISPEGFRFNICIDQHRCKVDPFDGLSQWYRRLWQDKRFRNKVYKRWTYLRAGALSDENIEAFLDDTKPRVKDAVLRNYKKWRKSLNASKSNKANLEVWNLEVQTMEKWLFKRLKWIDTQLIKEPLKLAEPPTRREDASSG